MSQSIHNTTNAILVFSSYRSLQRASPQPPPIFLNTAQQIPSQCSQDSELCCVTYSTQLSKCYTCALKISISLAQCPRLHHTQQMPYHCSQDFDLSDLSLPRLHSLSSTWQIPTIFNVIFQQRLEAWNILGNDTCFASLSRLFLSYQADRSQKVLEDRSSWRKYLLIFLKQNISFSFVH